MFQTKVVETIFVQYLQYLPEYRDVYVTMWKYAVQPNMPQINDTANPLCKPHMHTLLLFHSNNGRTNAPHCYFYTNINCIVS
jgi:hypothetical protein